MLDSPHTSAPMLMRGNALVLKTPVENALRTSVEKHLSWSSDIPPAARFPARPHCRVPPPPASHTTFVCDLFFFLADRTNPFARAILVSEILGILALTMFSLLQYKR